MYTLLALVSAITAAVWVYFRQLYSTFSKAGVKSMPTVPLLGNMAGVMLKTKHFAKFNDELYFNYPGERFVGRYEYTKQVLLIRDIELVKKIVVKDFEHFLDHRRFIDEDVDPLFGRNLFSLRGQEWKEMRSTLSPAFTSSKMRLMVPFMVDVGDQMVKALNRKIQTTSVPTDINVIDLCTRFANDVIASCAFGTKVDSMADVDNEFYTMGKKSATFEFKDMIKIFTSLSFPQIAKILRISLFSEDTKAFFRDLIISTMRIREEKNIIRNDMIHLLMETKKGKLSHEANNDTDLDAGFATVEESSVGKRNMHKVWSDDDLVAQALLFFIAGFDTVSTGMSFLFHELAMNPEIQERLVQEIKENDAKNGGKFDYKSIQEMKYMDMVVSESLRKWPPALALDRVCTKDYNCGKPNDKAKKDFILRKGNALSVPVWAFHRDPQYFPDPLRFDPERFSDENKHKIHPFAYMPFGLGPRNCIGSRFALCEIKVMTYMLLRHLELSPSEKTCLPVELSNDKLSPTLKGGHWVNFKIRTNSMPCSKNNL